MGSIKRGGWGKSEERIAGITKSLRKRKEARNSKKRRRPKVCFREKKGELLIPLSIEKGEGWRLNLTYMSRESENARPAQIQEMEGGASEKGGIPQKGLYKETSLKSLSVRRRSG